MPEVKLVIAEFNYRPAADENVTYKVNITKKNNHSAGYMGTLNFMDLIDNGDGNN